MTSADNRVKAYVDYRYDETLKETRPGDNMPFHYNVNGTWNFSYPYRSNGGFVLEYVEMTK